MASQPSGYNEERNLLRLRAWEQRNQETSQAKELNHDNVPLFGEPYKTNKGDELSNRIQKMLGNYEDVNNPTVLEPLPIPTDVTFSLSDQGHKIMDNQTKPPFHNQAQCISTQSQKAPISNGYSSRPTRTLCASSSPNHFGNSSTLSSLNHSQHNQSVDQQKRSELREHAIVSQEVCSPSPEAKSLPLQCSRDHDNTDTDSKDTTDRCQLQGSTDRLPELAKTVDVSTFILRDSPKDACLPQANKGNTLPPQTFPSLLSKQPSVVMTQKPTAYVRPMDGQDQVVNESPELKPSPEPYVPLPELINTSDLRKEKMLPQFLEMRPNEAQCVEDILREMTCSWPPILTAINTPNSTEASKSPFQSKGAEQVPSCPGQTVIPEKCNLSPADSSQHILQSSSRLFEAPNSKGLESTSSSDSESSSRSESDSESTAEEPHQHPASNAVKAEPDGPGGNHVDWQLGNWIRSSQQNSCVEGQGSAHASEGPQPPPTQSSKHCCLEAVKPNKESKPHLSFQRKEFTDTVEKTPKYKEADWDSYKQQSSQTSPTSIGDLNSGSKKPSCTAYSPKQSRTGNTQVPLDVECENAVATSEKDPRFTDKPKVKTKAGRSKKIKARSDTKKDNKRTSKHTSHDKQKAGSKSEVALVLYGHCPSCGVQYPTSCSCPTQSPVQPDQLSPAPPIRISCSKSNSEALCQKGTKIPSKTKHVHLDKPRTKSSHDPRRPPRSLLVKIELSLLTKVPQISGNHQEALRNAKRSARVIEQDGRASEAPTNQKSTKTSKTTVHQNAKADKTIPRKKPRLENKNASSSHASVNLASSSNSAEQRERKKSKKNPLLEQLPSTPSETSKMSKLNKHSSGKIQETNKESGKNKDSRKHKKSSGKHSEHSRLEKKTSKVSDTLPSSSEPLTKRPLLRFEDRQYPVKHYIKEAKKLKHRADAESDKLRKAFSYLDAAMYFVESGIAMERDPQISMSSYTMFAETVELLKFVLKLKNSADASAPPSEKDLVVLCLKCQSLLHMAMFRHKHKTATKFSRTLTDHFSNSVQKTHNPSVLPPKDADTPSPMHNLPSPAFTSSGPASNHSGSGLVDPGISTVALPQAIEQVAFTYVNITTLFLRAHDIWEQAEELAHKGTGMLTELDTVMGPLSLMSNMNFMVRYTRQGVEWLRLDCQKGH